jgi:LmbE family N-acetylglucosaminyl deacetylase
MIENKKILVLAPHTDDSEFGCSGSFARCVQEGRDPWDMIAPERAL